MTAPAVGEVLVAGMTCEHCVTAVREEVLAIHDVQDVQVDLVSGGMSRVRITSTRPLEAAAVETAVREAGYRLAP